MIFRKYEFLPEKWEEMKANIQDENGWLPDVVSVVELGHLLINNEPSEKYSVDILWQDQEAEGFEPYQIWCEPIGCHSFGYSIDVEYVNAWMERQ